MLRLAFDFIITWRETRTRPNAYSNSAGHDKDKLHATILFLRWMRNMFSDYVDDPELIGALQCYIHTILRISLHKHYNICGLWGVSMALGRFNKRAAFTTFFRNFRLFS